MRKLLWFRLALAIVTSFHLLPPPVSAAVSDMPPPEIPDSRPSCPSICGDVHIPYPFGIGDDCSWSGVHEYFALTCDHSYSPPRPYWANVEVIDISVDTGEMRVFSPVSYMCYNSSNTTERHGMRTWNLDYTDSPLLISPTRNQFIAIGCNTLALLDGREDWSYYTGCITSCISLDSAAHDGEECTGLGCCQTSISGNLSTVEVYWRNGNKTRINPAWRYSPCSYAFIAEKGWYKFSRRDLVRNGNDSFYRRAGKRTIPLVLDWAIRRDGWSCRRPALKDGGTSAILTAPACVSPHSYCVDAPQGHGYLCKCSAGYAGNPYVTGLGECTNINECDLRKSNPAKYETLYPCQHGSKCHDIQGDYKCTCKFGQRGDGKRENGCQPIFPVYGIAIIAASIAVVLACCMTILVQKRKERKLFSKNGGDILNSVGIKIFTKEELKTITKRYKKRIGGGFFGDVYKGTIIKDGAEVQQVAVKCTVAKKLAWQRQKEMDGEATQHEQESSWRDGFVNEITFQFQIRHPNVVRLIGCCLETDVPILVFEFVSNGSLNDKLHGAEENCTLSLQQRLDIAIGSADAISHMHSNGDYNHVHGDIKPANILLDDNLNAKVSDFGSSKLISIKKYVRGVAGDSSYVDPEYYSTKRFTVKSDVYSFGVVLLELITRKTARYGEKKDMSLLEFVKVWEDENKRRSMYDKDIISNEPCLNMVGSLAIKCLNGNGAMRPTMGEVLVELQNIRSKASAGSCSQESESVPLLHEANFNDAGSH